jgi:hypothetical protein
MRNASARDDPSHRDQAGLTVPGVPPGHRRVAHARDADASAAKRRARHDFGPSVAAA